MLCTSWAGGEGLEVLVRVLECFVDGWKGLECEGFVKGKEGLWAVFP